MSYCVYCFFLNVTATTEIYTYWHTLSLHDALPISLSFPELVGVGALAPIAIPTVFGEKWAEAGELAQIFAFMALPFTLNFFASPSLSVLGASRSLISLSTTQLVLGVILTLAALPFGLFAVAVSYVGRSEEHTSELQSLMRNSYAVFSLQKKK